MANKRQYQGDFAEENFSSDDDDVDMPVEHRPRGRPSKMSLSRLSPTEDVSTPSTTRRRGRGPSKRPCANRNAEMARQNRQKKKEYIEKTENKLKLCLRENQELNATIQRQNAEIKRLGIEVKYLKNILENNTHITNLMKAVNESLKKMREQGDDPSEEADESAKGLSRPSADVLNWVVRGETKAPNHMLVPVSGIDNKIELDISQKCTNNTLCNGPSPSGIARKTMPIKLPNSENLPSNEGYFDDQILLKSSPQSESCEYYTDKSSVGVATTPMSNMSNSMDKCEASLSDTDFSQLSSFDVDLLYNIDRIEDVGDPLQFEQDTSALFNEDTLFYPLETDSDLIKCSPTVVDSIDKNKASNKKSIFSTPENTGVCLHINSSRVSLEYCSYCYMNSLNNLNS